MHERENLREFIMRTKPKQPEKPKTRKKPRVVTVHVTIKNTPPDAARLAAHQDAIQTIMAVLQTIGDRGSERSEGPMGRVELG